MPSKKSRKEANDVEITERPTRRQFSKEYKLSILEEGDRCGPGELGALMRREGLYSSHLCTWRSQRREGALTALGRKRGPKPKRTAEDIELEKLRKENDRLREKLRKAEKIIEVQKKSGQHPQPERRGDGLKNALGELAEEVGVTVAAEALGVPRSTAYRWQQPTMFGPRKPRPKPKHALSEPEQARVLETLHDERFVVKAPRAVYAVLLEEGEHLCSVRTMYRILASQSEVRERRAQCRHPKYARPELLATAPNEVWTWDVTWLRGPAKYVYYRLYVILDLFSRYVTGWMLAHEENGALAAKLIREAYRRHSIQPEQLTLHADRGSAQRGKTVKQLLGDLEVNPSFSRPRVSNDNPFSESQFRTLKYAPDFPERFVSFEHGLEHCRSFFDWYNNDHRHRGIAFMTPADVFHGHAGEVAARRQAALDAAYDRHPQRFRAGPPKAALPPPAVYLNPPEDRSQSELVVP